MKSVLGYGGVMARSFKYQLNYLSGTKMLLAIWMVLILTFQSLSAGVSIKGRIYDKNSNQSLAAANVMIKGTSIGSAADLDGMYVIHNAPSGTQTIVVTYIGYVSVSTDLAVPDYGTLTKDFALEPEVVQGKEVVVLAQGLGQIQAINQQLASDKISNVVSEAKIQELPDFNAAQALSRLPGVSSTESSGEANKIVIRGLAPQYNSISIEGVKLASTGSRQIGVVALPGLSETSISNDRSVDISMVSPYMIKTISVFKSLTPDMDANSIGGSVNMELREAPSELHYDLLYQQGYTAKTGSYGNYRIVGSVSNRFLNDNLGAYLLVNAEKYDRDADYMKAEYKTEESRVDTLTGWRNVIERYVSLNRHIETRQRYGGNLILDYRLPAGSIKMINMYTRLLSDFFDINTDLNFDNEIQKFNLHDGENTTDMVVNSLNLDYDFRWVKMDLKLARTSSENNMPESPYIQFKSRGGTVFSDIPENTKPEDLGSYVIYQGSDSIYLDNVNLWSSLYKEEKNTASTNFKIPFGLGHHLTGYIKMGGQYHHQKNSNDQKTPYAGMQKGTGFQEDMIEDVESKFGIAVDTETNKFTGSNFMGDPYYTRPIFKDKYGRVHFTCDPTIPMAIARYLASNSEWEGRVGGPENTGGWYDGIFQNLANSYLYSETYSAGYLMSEITYRDFMIVGGARYEKMDSKYTSYNMYDMRSPGGQKCDTVTTKPSNEFWLPQVQTKYTPFNWMDIRYSYTQTLARPDYHQLSPKVTYDNPRKTVHAGNPDLEPAQAFNHDLNLTFHGNKLGLLSIGAFYKTIENFTYSTSYKLYKTTEMENLKIVSDFNITGSAPAEGATLYTFINSPYKAYVKGVELDFQTRFWYLPGKLDGIVMGINYTMIESEATYPMYDDTTDYTVRPAVTYTIYQPRKGRLIYQPNDVVNGYVGYEFKGFSARLSFLFQGNSVSGIGGYPENDGFTKDYFRIDASIRQKLPWYGMEIFLDVANLNNETNYAAQPSFGGLKNVKHYGTVTNLGVRVRL